MTQWDQPELIRLVKAQVDAGSNDRIILRFPIRLENMVWHGLEVGPAFR